jgi:Flp pilus assembly protein TadG
VTVRPAHIPALCRRLRRDEDGQVLALVAVGMVGICAMAGFAIDVGSFFQAHRKQQSIADASALAAGSDLPLNTTLASADAQEYASKNGGSTSSIAFSTTYMANDTVTVETSQTVPSTFLKVLGINQATVRASAIVRAETLQDAWGSAPFAVINTQPELAGPGCPCYGVTTTLTLGKVGPGGFQIINVDGSRGGTGQSILAGWILDGCACETTAPNWYYSDSGAKFNSSEVKSAMDARIGDNLLFPVYDAVSGGGTNLQYHVIGFAGFNVTGYSFQGGGGTIDGSFVHVNWQGTGTSNTTNFFGATNARLVG